MKKELYLVKYTVIKQDRYAEYGQEDYTHATSTSVAVSNIRSRIRRKNRTWRIVDAMPILVVKNEMSEQLSLFNNKEE